MKIFVIAFLAIAVASAVPVEEKKVICNPGSLVKKDCNDCMCSPDGTSMACTLMLCVPHEQIGDGRTRRETQPQNLEKICEPGETKMEDCNNCFCAGDGTAWACTLKACLHQVCVPGTRYKKYCNECACNDDGTAEMCTRKGCPKNMYNEDGSLVNSRR